MKIVKYPQKKEWKALLQRPSMDAIVLEGKVKAILDEIRNDGDAAKKKYTTQFDGVTLDDFAVTSSEIVEAEKGLSNSLKQAIVQAAANIRLFHEKQLSRPEIVETMPGVQCWRKQVAIEKVGLYIPGGTAPLFSTLLMLSIPAVIAGCKEIVLCTPPNKKGSIDPAILFAAAHVGVTRIFKCGGVQAIGAMAYGTETVPQVYKIFGPGNQYVVCAKQLVQQQGIAIDMLAGPSEVAVYADKTAVPDFVAADLLSQAEHGVDSQVLLVTNSEELPTKVHTAIQQQLSLLPRKELATQALENSKIIIVNNDVEAMALLNEYAPEHLILNCHNALALSDSVVNAGSVFIGGYSPESVGDYASGTNHTLPTNGYAKAYSGVSIDSFVKKITFQQLSKQGLQHIGKTVTTMAEAEGLQAHANAVSIRLNH
jgi:histidinol dehydrogenase